jgi:hypothetical protein
MMTHQQEQIKTFTNERKVNASDELCDAEIAACKAAREKANGNGSQSQRQSVSRCNCVETVMPDGSRRALHNEASCLYTAARSALVFSASTLAAATGATGNDFTRAFAKEMERMAAPLLRQSHNGAHEQKAV